jgi:hypothetical protein
MNAIVIRLTPQEVRTYDEVPHLWLNRRDAYALIGILEGEIRKQEHALFLLRLHGDDPDPDQEPDLAESGHI